MLLALEHTPMRRAPASIYGHARCMPATCAQVSFESLESLEAALTADRRSLMATLSAMASDKIVTPQKQSVLAHRSCRMALASLPYRCLIRPDAC